MPGWSGASRCWCRRSLCWARLRRRSTSSSALLGLAFDVAVLYLTLGFRQFSHYFTDIRDGARPRRRGRGAAAARRVAASRRQRAAAQRAAAPRRSSTRCSPRTATSSASSSGSSLLSTFGLGPGRRGALPHGRVRQPLLGLPQRRRRGIAVNERLMRAVAAPVPPARPRAGAAHRARASRWSATSRRRSTAGAATPASGSTTTRA